MQTSTMSVQSSLTRALPVSIDSSELDLGLYHLSVLAAVRVPSFADQTA
jgi:hypothetical protein